MCACVGPGGWPIWWGRAAFGFVLVKELPHSAWTVVTKMFLALRHSEEVLKGDVRQNELLQTCVGVELTRRENVDASGAGAATENLVCEAHL